MFETKSTSVVLKGFPIIIRVCQTIDVLKPRGKESNLRMGKIHDPLSGKGRVKDILFCDMMKYMHTFVCLSYLRFVIDLLLTSYS